METEIYIGKILRRLGKQKLYGRFKDKWIVGLMEGHVTTHQQNID